MIKLLKEKIYHLLTNDLSYPVTDTAYSINDKITYPFIRLTLKNIKRESNEKTFKYNCFFQIDIFDNYKGEKTIYEIEQEIYNAIKTLYNWENLISITVDSFHIIDDKSTGELKKHGIIIYNFTLSGGLTEELNNE